MAEALVPLADGVEEMEAVIIMDVLRRAKWRVVGCGLRPGLVTASRGVLLQPDTEWDRIDPLAFEVLVLPGGAGGTQALSDDARVLETVRRFVRDQRLVGAICAAPRVLKAAGVVGGRRITCHPSVRDAFGEHPISNERVVVDGRLVTSQGPGTTFEFALKLIALVDGPPAAEAVAKGLIL
jgi:4-methyl-5(b-hydroxyethyl)-thiazole monophosphate biosynthesis